MAIEALFDLDLADEIIEAERKFLVDQTGDGNCPGSHGEFRGGPRDLLVEAEFVKVVVVRVDGLRCYRAVDHITAVAGGGVERGGRIGISISGIRPAEGKRRSARDNLPPVEPDRFRRCQMLRDLPALPAPDEHGTPPKRARYS
jgi:hypothetical protein